MQQFNSKTVKLLKLVEEKEEEEEEGTTDEEIIFQSLELHSLKIVTSLESWKVSNLKISHLIAYFKTQWLDRRNTQSYRKLATKKTREEKRREERRRGD